jgi:hypothetical protein
MLFSEYETLKTVKNRNVTTFLLVEVIIKKKSRNLL